MVTVKKIEAQHLPEVDEAFAKSLGIADGTVEGLRADIRKNLEREVKFRVLARNKASRDGRAGQGRRARRAEVAASPARSSAWSKATRADLKQRGIKDADKAPIPAEMFQAAGRAPRAPGPGRGRAGARQQPAGQARAAQGAHRGDGAELREAGRSGALVPRATASAWPRSRRSWSRTTSTDFVLGKAKVTDKAVPFDELMAAEQRLIRRGAGRRGAWLRRLPSHNRPRHVVRSTPLREQDFHERTGNPRPGHGADGHRDSRAAASAPTTSTSACCASA